MFNCYQIYFVLTNSFKDDSSERNNFIRVVFVNLGRFQMKNISKKNCKIYKPKINQTLFLDSSRVQRLSRWNSNLQICHWYIMWRYKTFASKYVSHSEDTVQHYHTRTNAWISFSKHLLSIVNKLHLKILLLSTERGRHWFTS